MNTTILSGWASPPDLSEPAKLQTTLYTHDTRPVNGVITNPADKRTGFTPVPRSSGLTPNRKPCYVGSMTPRIDLVELSDSELNRQYKRIEDMWERHLKPQGIAFPSKYGKTAVGTFWSGATLQLVCLAAHEGKFVSKEALSFFVTEHNPNLKGDQQARHLGTQRGFNVLCAGDHLPSGEPVPFGYYILLNMTNTKPGWRK